jgi:hypothetical protein
VVILVSRSATAGPCRNPEKLSGDLLAQFMDVQADQMQRIEELSLEMRGRLIELQNTVGAQLDASWHTPLTHIGEAGRRPTHRAQELELARKYLIYAWGEAESLLERDPRSMDPAALRCPLAAQQIAAVSSFLGEPQNTVHWLEAAYIASRSQLDHQVSAVHDVFAQEMRHAKRGSRDDQSPLISVWTRSSMSKDPLWVHAPYRDMSLSGRGYIKRNLDFEGRLAALVALDAEAQLLRLACLDAGAKEAILRPGTAPRSATIDSVRKGECRALLLGDYAWHPPLLVGHKDLVPTAAFVVFDAMTAADMNVFDLRHFDLGDSFDKLEVGNSFDKLIDDRYRKILPLEIGTSELWGL